MYSFKIGDIVVIRDGSTVLSEYSYYKWARNIFLRVLNYKKHPSGSIFYHVRVIANLGKMGDARSVPLKTVWSFSPNELELAPKLYQVIYGD